jgi:T-complex protein 1 subunit gamma
MQQPQQQQVMVFNENLERQQGKQAMANNIEAAKVISGLITSTLGPCAMLKMIIDPMGGTIMTNDGNCILREIDVIHPAAKHMLELARAQDEEVGDGTTAVIILTGEILTLAQPLLERKVHPLKIVKGFTHAMTDALKIIEAAATSINPDNEDELNGVVKACLGTKFNSRAEELMCNLAVQATLRVVRVNPHKGTKEIDIKRYAKIEKIPGSTMDASEVLDGVMFNKDHVNAKMRRRIENPKILLIDTPLEYKKSETTIAIEVTKEEDWETLLKQEEDFLRMQAKCIIALKPDVVITEKGVSDLTAHFLAKANITCIRRLRKTDTNRIARATGATIVSRVEEMTVDVLGHGASLFEIKKIGDEYFTFITGCPKGSACTVILRGASKDTLNEMERNLHDAMCVARNIILEPRVLYGAGSIEMHTAVKLAENAKSLSGDHQAAYQALGLAQEIIPRTIAQNCGANTIRVVTELRAKHSDSANLSWGIDGIKGNMVDVKELKVVEPAAVKLQALKTAVEAACMILRVDDIVSGTTVKGNEKAAPKATEEDPQEVMEK